MGVRIESAWAARVPGFEKGSRALAAEAALACWSGAGLHQEDLSLLVYAGTYRDNSVMEPAQAPYVQRALAWSGGTSPGLDTCFSFDVGDLLTAVEISEGMVRSRGMARAMVVGADCRVEFSSLGGGAIDAAAGALLLTHTDDVGGFVAFHSAVFPQHMELHQGSLQWTAAGDSAGHALVVCEHPDYLAACVDSAETAVHQFLEDLGVARGDIQLVVTSQSPGGFPVSLAARLDLSDECIVRGTATGGSLNTAGLIAALAEAMRDGRFARARQVLLLTVSPGITVHAALYRAT